MELQDFLKETDLNPAKARPSSITQENLAPRPNFPDSVMMSEADEKDMQRRIQALKNPSEVSPVSNPQSTSPIFAFGSTGQSKIPQFFSMGSTREMPYPRLDGHSRRITPIPIPQAQNQPVSPALNKSPEQIQEEASELIQRYENEKAESERLAAKY